MFNSLQSHFSWVQRRSCHILELGDGLPGGGYLSARNRMWVCALSIVLSSQWIWLKALSCSCWWGMTFVMLCLWSIVLWVTPWRFWAQAASSLAVSLGKVCTYRRGSHFYRSVVPSLSPLEARPDFCWKWNRVINLFSFVHLVLQSRSHLGSQEGFAWPGNQTLWVNLKAGCPGAHSSGTLGWQFHSHSLVLHQVCSFLCSRELQLQCLTQDFTAATFHLYCSVPTICSCQWLAAESAVEGETLLYISLF